MLLTCNQCHKEYNSIKSSRQFCSKKCAIDNRKLNPDYIASLKKPKTQRLLVKSNCLYCNTEISSTKNAKYCSTSCSNKHRLLGNGILKPIECKHCKSLFKPVRSSTSFCSTNCSSEFKKSDLNFILALKAGCLQRSANPEYLEKLSSKATERWATDEFRKKMLEIYSSDDFLEKSNDNYTLKDYVLPSGNIVKVQGYEPQALDILLKYYSEEDLILGASAIKEKVGVIMYTDNKGKKHRYFPDIYILSINKIIEVKSGWTYKIQKDVNELKKEACVNAGIDFEFMII
jgi:hypothetical protein